MKDIKMEYRYHDRFQEEISRMEDEALQKENLTRWKLSDDIQFMEETIQKSGTVNIPSHLLESRFLQVVQRARDLAYRTTSNVYIRLSKGYWVTICMEGDYFIVNDVKVKYLFTRLFEACVDFQVLSKEKLFCIIFAFDLRWIE